MQRAKRYCGRKSDILCICCNGICGPTNGCQCSNCRKNDSRKSQENGKYYCGNKNDIPCLCCNGFCGPNNGHQCSACKQKQLEEQKTIYQQVNIGMNQGKVYIGQKGSLKFVSKELNNLIQVKNYEILAKLGIGVNILETKGCTIKMEYGQPLDQIINQLNQSQKQTILFQLKNIQKILIQNKLVHTDIKSANIVIIFNESSIRTKLIDADNLVAFGQNRQVCTFGQNITTQKPENEIWKAVNETTDRNGFERIYELLS